MNRSSLLVALLFAWGCSTTTSLSPPPQDAGRDAAVDAKVPTDTAAPERCMTTTLAMTLGSPMWLADMCSLTVSPTNNRWYFHYEGPGFVRTGDETLGYCPATWSSP